MNKRTVFVLTLMCATPCFVSQAQERTAKLEQRVTELMCVYAHMHTHYSRVSNHFILQAQERTAKLEQRVTELTEYSEELESRVEELESEVALQASNAARVAEEAEERIREVCVYLFVCGISFDRVRKSVSCHMKGGVASEQCSSRCRSGGTHS